MRSPALIPLVCVCLGVAMLGAPAQDASHIYGIHSWGWGAGGLLQGKSGWSVEVVHTEPYPFDLTHADAVQIVAEGFTLIIRIDYQAPSQTLPETSGAIASYVSGCAAKVAEFGDVCHTWILGNEFNADFGGSVPVATAESVYRQVADAIHAAQPEAIVLVGAIAPWNATLTGSGPYPSNRQWLNYFYDLVQRLGGDADGFAIHAYGGRGGDSDPRDDDEMGFGVYQRWMEIIDSHPEASQRPVYLTEMNHAADGDGATPGFPLYPYSAGYIQRLFEEIGTWNELEPHRIRCACWFSHANGGFPGYNISTNGQMADDFRDAASHSNWIGADTTGVGTGMWAIYR